MCLLVSRAMRVRLEEIDPDSVLLGVLKNPLLSVSFSLPVFQCLFPFQNDALLCVKPFVRLQRYSTCKPHNLFSICHTIVRMPPDRD